MFESSRVHRGMVFWCNLQRAYGWQNTYTSKVGKAPTHITVKNRPYVVVSCDENNFASPVCNVVPITTAVKKPLPSHVAVKFPGDATTIQTILTEQITTVDVDALDDYICTLSDATMTRVNAALISQLGITTPIVCTESTIKYVEGVITEIINRKFAERQAQTTSAAVEDAALRVGSALEMLFSSSQPSEASETSPEKTKIATPKKRLWTESLCNQYLEEFEKYSLEDMAVRWGLSSADSARSTKYNCLQRLKRFKETDKK